MTEEPDDLHETQEQEWGPALVGLGFAVPMFVLEGLVLSMLWIWFMVPLGVPPIGIAHAVGLVALIGLVGPGPRLRDDEPLTWQRLRSQIGHSVFKMATIFVVGAIAHEVMA